jgi:hypothetical protein
MDTQNKANIMVFGIDRLGYRVPRKPLELKNSILHFRDFNTEEKFQDYDGVVLFNEIFEEFSDRQEYLGFHEKDLLMRENQLRQLVEKKGFCCFLLWIKFTDYYGLGSSHSQTRDTDLVKRVLNSSFVYWGSFEKPTTNLRIVRDEFWLFLKDFGSVQTNFTYSEEYFNLKPICFAGDDLTGFVLNNSIFFIPCLLADKREKEFKEYFSLLADALVPSFKKLTQELPTWTEEYLFSDEEKLLAEKDSISKRIVDINQGLAIFSEYKKCLCCDDELLKESVISILQNGFKFPVDAEDQLKEDLKILDQNKEPMILVEVKGTNKGISREFINQADSHRERSEFSPDFPSILIVNTNIKNAKSLDDKYQEIAKEQVTHAVKMEILVLRTIDLLNLLYLTEAGKVTPEEVLEIFKREHGWLKTTQKEYQIDKGIK